MQKLIIKSILLLPILLTITVINYFVDPAHLFHKIKDQPYDYERKIAQLLLQNKNVTNISNYNERLKQKFFVQELNNKKDIIIIGSSRTMNIRSPLFLQETLYNNSVSGAVLQDYFSIYYLYRQKKLLPLKIILGVDPWIFNKNYGESRWESLKEEYNSLLKIIIADNFIIKYKISDIIPKNWQELFSLSYFQTSWNQFVSGRSKSKIVMLHQEPIFTFNDYNENPTILSDGSYTYDRKSYERTAEEVRILAENSVTQRNSYGFDSFFEIDKITQSNFEKFISLLNKDGVEVVLYLPPYHHKAYEIMSKLPKYRILKDVENYLVNFSKKNKIQLVGSYNPNNLAISEDDFLDGMHCKDTAIQKIFSKN